MLSLTVPSTPTTPPPPPASRSAAASHEQQQHPLLPFLRDCQGMPQLKQIHARAMRTAPFTTSSSTSLSDLLFLYSRIVHFAASADLDYASRLLFLLLDPRFIVLPPNHSFMWNTLIRAYARSPDRKHAALDLYRRVLLDGRLAPDKYTFPFVLKACAFLFALSEGAQIHAHVVKLGFSSDVYVANSLIHFYASCGRVELARHLFDGMLYRSIVSWNVVIDGLVRGGDFGTALVLFREMQSAFAPDAFTLQSVISACGGLGALSLGMWAHAFVLRECGGVDVAGDVLINNSLLDMYSKCGSVGMARQLFDTMPYRDVASWNAMIFGLAMHGLVKESMEAFSRMSDSDKLSPNSITFVGILSACNHGGLVSEGRSYFSSMATNFGVEPQIEHYGCMVDLLARAGSIDEAIELVSSMPCKPDAVIWRSLLDACWKANAGVEVGESVASRILELDGAKSGVYVLLSRVYASANRWNDVGLVRRLMSEEGIRKEPGCSLVEIDGIAHEFVAGDTSHPRSNEIYVMLQVIEDRLGSVGYAPDLSQAPMVAEHDGEKRRSLRLHSERLAIAFGLLDSVEPRTPIRVLKNLRMCKDCHAMTKLVSLVFGVEIVVRDRIRFHHFKHGSCSCTDYW